MKALTDRQRETLAYIRHVYGETGRGPAIREIASALDVTVCTAFQHVKALVRKGQVTKGDYEYYSLVPAGVPSPKERIAALERENAHLRAELAAALNGAAIC